jgi:DNA-binding response OmpR family regulator
MKRTILVADAEPRSCSELKKKLAANSYDVFYATDLEEAVRRFDVKLADLLLVDLDVPTGEVWDALARVAQLNPSLPVIGLTERSEGSEIALRARLNGVAEKPIAPGNLVGFIQELLKEGSRWTEFRYVAPKTQGPRGRSSHRAHELSGYAAACSSGWGINE